MRTSYSHWWVHLFGVSLAVLCAAIPLRATVLENFESTTSWTFVWDFGSSLDVSTVTGVSGNALELEYSLRNGSGVGLIKNGFGSLDVNALGSNALRFFYKAGSLPSTIEIKLSDSDYVDPGLSTKSVLKFTAKGDNQWHEVIAQFNNFDIWTDTGLDGETDTATFDWSKVSHLSYGVSGSSGTAGSDTIRFEDFSFYSLNAPVPLVNSYENFVPSCWVTNACLNERAGPRASLAFPVEHPEWGSSTIVSTQAAPGSGTHSREIRYTLPALGGGYFGLSEVLEGISVVGTDRIEFYAKGVAGGEPLKLEVKSPGLSQKIVVPTAITTDWQNIAVPFSLFPTLDLSNITEIVFLFETRPSAGRIYIDDVRVVSPGSATLGSVVKVLEDYSGSKLNLGYGEYPRDNVASLSLTFEADNSIGSVGNKVGRLDYTFKNSSDVPWAVVERPLGINLLVEPQVRFKFKGDGSDQSIEVLLMDTDATLFKKTLFNASNTAGQWKTVTLPVDQFSFFAPGADSKLKLTQIDGIQILLVPGGTSFGTFTIDSLELVAPTNMEKTNMDGLISSVLTPDNPFSPNGDGLKDIFNVNYVLTNPARVVFRVFNLQGVPILVMDKGAQPSGENVVAWDGRDDGGTLLANGVYFFTLEAKSDFSGDQTFRQIVGVMR